ncbi:hypothetical protein BST81_22260 [Leptolyngbya sp. 'hensonii']|nr:hypothetical protein BST81_22260 [Leptolyngbya sp. 'hensonii']
MVSALSAFTPIAFACMPPMPQGQSVVGAMNRAQQAFYLEKNTFASSINELGMRPSGDSAFTYSIQKANKVVYNVGTARNPNQVSYIGAVFEVAATDLDKKAVKGETKTLAILCRGNSPGAIRSLPSYKDGSAVCGVGTQQVYRNR